MLNKIKVMIITRIKKLLGIIDIENKQREYEKSSNGRISTLEAKSDFHGRILNKHEEKIQSLHTTLSNVVSIGVDHHLYNTGQSWAVVCIEGNYNIVKFIPLNEKDARSIHHFLKNFEASKYVYDAPMSFIPKGMFIEWNK